MMFRRCSTSSCEKKGLTWSSCSAQAPILLVIFFVILVSGCQDVPQSPNTAGGSVGQAENNGITYEACPDESAESEPPPITTLPETSLPPSFKGYILQNYCWKGEWYFNLTPGLNAVQPCAEQARDIPADVPNITLKGVDSLKSLLDQLQAGEYVTWCSSNLPDIGVVEDFLAYSEQEDIRLTLLNDLDPDPTVAYPSPTAHRLMSAVALDRRPDSTVTSSIRTPDGSLWYAFDVYDEAGDSPPDSQYQSLYRLEKGEVTHFVIPATIRVLEVGPEEDLYVGAGCGLMRFRDGSWETLLELECGRRGPAARLIPLDIAFAGDGTMWVGEAYSLASYHDESWTEFDIPAVRVAIGSDGTVWTRGWDGRAESSCCVTHIVDDQQVTYDWSADIPADPELLEILFDGNPPPKIDLTTTPEQNNPTSEPAVLPPSLKGFDFHIPN